MSLSRKNPRRDTNEAAIVHALRAVGCQVTQVSGKGSPDIIVRPPGKPSGWCYAFEIKSPQGKRTQAQKVSSWPILRSVEMALEAIGVKV